MSIDLEDDLRRAFAARAAATSVGRVPASIDLDRVGDELAARRRHWATPAVAAASALLLVGGLIVATRSRDAADTAGQPPSAVLLPIAGADLVIEDPMAIDLDAWRDAADVPAGGASLALDRARLPRSLTVDGEQGTVLLDEFIGGYRYVATLTSTDHGAVVLTVEERPVEPCDTRSSSATVGDLPASATDGRVCWRLPSGLTVGLAADDDSNSADENAPNTGDLLAIAESLAFTTVDEPPSTTIDEDTPPEDRLVGEPQIAGTLDGVPWSAQVDPGALRTMFVYVDGRRNSGFENDRLSQPSDLPAAGPGEISLSGIDGSGAIIFGYTSPEVDRILVRRTDGQAALLPVFGRDLESYFAIPVPDGLTIETITFLTGDGLPYRVATIPPLPAGLGGTYGGYIEAVRPEATAASAPSADGAETPVAPIGADVEAAARLDAEQEAARVAARGAAEPFVGQTLDEFKRSVGDLGYVVRVTSIDGRPQPARADLRLDRINVGVDGSTVVTSIASVG